MTMTTDERQRAIDAASKAMAECGYDFPLPVDGDLDDEERGRYDALCAAIDAAFAAVPADARRLDFLETLTRRSSVTGLSFDWIPSVEGEKSVFRLMTRHNIREPKPSIRDAIDAALIAEQREVKS